MPQPWIIYNYYSFYWHFSFDIHYWHYLTFLQRTPPEKIAANFRTVFIVFVCLIFIGMWSIMVMWIGLAWNIVNVNYYNSNINIFWTKWFGMFYPFIIHFGDLYLTQPLLSYFNPGSHLIYLASCHVLHSPFVHWKWTTINIPTEYMDLLTNLIISHVQV